MQVWVSWVRQGRRHDGGLMERMCHCGKPLHYSDPAMRERVDRMVDELGDVIVVKIGGRRWAVPRHYIALHGLKAAEIADLGFEEWK